MNRLDNFNKSFWLQFVPAIVTGTATIVLFAMGTIPLYYLWATLVMWILVCGLGVAVGYHRIFSHKTHTLPTWKENIILLLAVLSGQGGSIFWVALHRGYHHPHSDTPKDIHSPVAYSKLQAFVGWQYDCTQANNPVNMKYAADLLRKPNHVWFHQHHIKVLWAVPLFVACFNWHLAMAAFCLVAMIGVVQDNLVNVYGHVATRISYRNFDTKDHSVNNPLLGYFAWGQGWHNNHHAHPRSYHFGKQVSGKWWEIDPCVIFLPLL